MENEFENKREDEKEPLEGSTEANAGNIPYGSDYNQENQSQPNSQSGQYHLDNAYGNNNQENSYGQGSNEFYRQGLSTYQAPDYGFCQNDNNQQDNSYNQQSNNYNQQQDNRYYDSQNQSFHNEYQENQNKGYDNRNKKKSGGTAKKVLMIAGCAIIVGVLAGAGFKGIDMLIGQSNNTTLIENQQNIDKSEEGNTNIGISDNSSIVSRPDSTIGKTSVIGNYTGNTIVSDIAEESMACMVSIDCTITDTYDYFGHNYSQDTTGSGSGFILGESDTELFIATNNHVVEGANSITITFIDATTAEATTKGTDSTADLAVVSVKKSDLKNDTIKQIKIASLGDSDNVRLGEMVVAIGNALGYGQSVTVGYISAKDREVEVTEGEKMILLQTDAAINPGNSGGALINLEGKVIGIPSVKYADSTIEGMGFAIPISRATPILDELMKREVLTEEEQGYLGVSCIDVTSDANTMYGIPVGVYVSAISDDGAAKEAGIQVGDIITAINGIETTSKEALVEKVHSYRIGTVITLTIQRSNNGKYKEMEVEAKLKEASTIDGLPDDSQNSNSNNSGNSSDGSNKGNGSSGDTFGNDDRNYYGNNGTDDFYDFFNEFFN